MIASTCCDKQSRQRKDEIKGALAQGVTDRINLICYSWITGISDVAMIVFVRKHMPEIQYLKTSIPEEQRGEFARVIETTVDQIESGHFPSHSGIRFPQNGCVNCPHLGLCLNDQQLVAVKLVRKTGASNLDWLDELVD